MMSGTAGWFRAMALQRQAGQAMKRARQLWLAIELAKGLGGWPPPGAEEHLARLVNDAERLTLESRAAL